MRKIIGGILLALALAVLIWEASEYAQFGEWRLIVFGEIAFRIFPEWLNLTQAIIERYILPWLWDPMIQTFLLWPAWPALVGLGVVMQLWGRLAGRR